MSSERDTNLARTPGPPGVPFISAHDKFVPLNVVSPMLAFAIERGWDPRELFPFLQFDGDQLAEDGRRLTYLEGREVYLRARDRLGDAFFIDYAFRKSLATLGIVGLGMMMQGSVEEALRFGLEYQALAGSVLRLEWDAQGDETAVVARDLFHEDELRQIWRIEHLLTVAHVVEQLPGQAAVPIRFEIEGQLCRESREALARRLTARLVEGSERSCIVYRSRDLRALLPFPDPAGAWMLRRAADRELAAIGWGASPSLVERIVGQGGARKGRREVSQELGISERTLDRMLAREGVQFSKVAVLRRMEKAKTLLRGGETVERAAELTGYSEARSFRRAFRKVTGLSPLAYKSGRNAAE